MNPERGTLRKFGKCKYQRTGSISRTCLFGFFRTQRLRIRLPRHIVGAWSNRSVTPSVSYGHPDHDLSQRRCARRSH